MVRSRHALRAPAPVLTKAGQSATRQQSRLAAAGHQPGRSMPRAAWQEQPRADLPVSRAPSAASRLPAERPHQPRGPGAVAAWTAVPAREHGPGVEAAGPTALSSQRLESPAVGDVHWLAVRTVRSARTQVAARRQRADWWLPPEWPRAASRARSVRAPGRQAAEQRAPVSPVLAALPRLAGCGPVRARQQAEAEPSPRRAERRRVQCRCRRGDALSEPNP